MDFKYEVAFSFLAQDEQHAIELNDLLKDRFDTFLYSERQRELVGTDGQEAFSRVYSAESRVVVVFLREGWGVSGMTVVEKNAIQNRGLRHDYDFAVFIKLDDSAVPTWLPFSRIWYNLKRFGMMGAAEAVEQRVRSMAGKGAPESVAEKAARAIRLQQFAKEREAYRFSFKGVEDARREYSSVIDRIAKHLEGDSVRGLGVLDRRQDIATIRGNGIGVAVDWTNYVSNSVTDAHLMVTFWLPFVPRSGIIVASREPRRVAEWKYAFDVTVDMEPMWLRGDAIVRSEVLADQIMEEFIERGIAQSQARR